jgi:hypothetical protein
VVPSSHYRCTVLVQEIGPSSSCVSVPSAPGPLSGQVVQAVHNNISSLCGVFCSASELWNGAYCTLGGLVVVDGSIYALTTSHVFLGRSGMFQALEYTGNKFIVSSGSFFTFESIILHYSAMFIALISSLVDAVPVRHLHSYKFTEAFLSSSNNFANKGKAEAISYDQDWG